MNIPAPPRWISTLMKAHARAIWGIRGSKWKSSLRSHYPKSCIATEHAAHRCNYCKVWTTEGKEFERQMIGEKNMKVFFIRRSIELKPLEHFTPLSCPRFDCFHSIAELWKMQTAWKSWGKREHWRAAKELKYWSYISAAKLYICIFFRALLALISW